MDTTTGTRRGFFETVGRYGAGATLAALAAETSRGFAANDTLNVGCIGTGGRCQTLIKSLVNVPGVRIAAVCDVYEKHLHAARGLADPKAVATAHYHEVLGRKDIDIVLIGSPDHWHVPMTVDACDAGKDVYVEKPLTHDRAEGQAVLDAQNRNARIVQVGTQQRSMPHIIKARELVKQGRIGRVVRVQMSWNRNQGGRTQRTPQGVDPKAVDWPAFLGKAPAQPFDEYKFRNWRWFWDFGGGLLTDLMVHWVDVAHWVLDYDHPQRATSFGDHLASAGVWETPDTIQCLLSYPNEVQMIFEGTFSNAHRGARIEFLGTDASLYIDRGGYVLEPERGQGKAESMILGTDPKRGRDFYDKPDGELLHLANWIGSVRSRSRPNCPAEAGVGSASAAHLGNQAYRSGQVAAWPDRANG